MFVFLRYKKSLPIRQTCNTVLLFTEISASLEKLFLVFQGTEGGKKSQNVYNKKEKILMN